MYPKRPQLFSDDELYEFLIKFLDEHKHADFFTCDKCIDIVNFMVVTEFGGDKHGNLNT